ncbi:MAG: hypothetical protein CME62_17275 [Halobacteriovoraceae bacterium]|nr:hypothetical protein [Halobacteriovoraceae bacterium]
MIILICTLIFYMLTLIYQNDLKWVGVLLSLVCVLPLIVEFNTPAYFYVFGAQYILLIFYLIYKDRVEHD